MFLSGLLIEIGALPANRDGGPAVTPVGLDEFDSAMAVSVVVSWLNDPSHSRESRERQLRRVVRRRSRWQFNPREPGLLSASSDATAGNAGLQKLLRDWHPGHQPGFRICHERLQRRQSVAYKAPAPPPVGIHLTAQVSQADGIALQTAHQHSDGDDFQQPIEALRFPQAGVRQLKDPRLLITEQLLAAEASLVAPDQIQAGSSVADQSPGLLHRQASRMGEQLVGALAAIGPQPDVPEATSVAAGQV